MAIFQSAVTICQTPPSPAFFTLKCLVQTLNLRFDCPLFCTGSLGFNLKSYFVEIPYAMVPLDTVLKSSASFLGIFCEFIHCPSQKYDSLECPGRGGCGSLMETSHETNPHQVQKKPNESNYGTSCHGVVWIPNTELQRLSIKCPQTPKNRQSLQDMLKTSRRY